MGRRLPISRSREELIASLGIGILVSFIAHLWQFEINLTWQFIIVAMISMIVGRIHTKLLCFSYTLPLTYLLSGFFSALTRGRIKVDLPYGQLILLVGVLHFIEGILTGRYGYRESTCVISYPQDKIAGGYELYRKWHIPLLLFYVNGFCVPLVAAIVYGDKTYTMLPEQKAHKMGIWITLYGILIGIVGYLIIKQQMMLLTGMIMMPALHEIIFIINERYEMRRLIYDKPQSGVRVLGGKDEHFFKRGDIILTINRKRINDEEGYYSLLKSLDENIEIEVIGLNKRYRKLRCNKEELKKQNIILLPNE